MSKTLITALTFALIMALLWSVQPAAHAAAPAEKQETPIEPVELSEAQQIEQDAEVLLEDSLDTLTSLVTLRDRLARDIRDATQQIEFVSDVENLICKNASNL